MTDIFIKSFNRPFYLDRCLSSVYQNITGSFQIHVLDDGTPEKYLLKIQGKYPDIKILKSPFYNEKSKEIHHYKTGNSEINGFRIPSGFWIDEATKASDYFIMTEDDVWFTRKINLGQLVSDCKKNGINLLKLGWLGNFKDDNNIKVSEINTEINRTVPTNLFLQNKAVMKAFFYNRYKFFSILYQLGFVNNYTRQKYWALNSILMGLYKKEYWLQIWDKMEAEVDEKRQLVNAAVAYRENKKNKNFIARLKKEAMKTTFQSAATNSYHQYGNNFDVNLFNHQMNEAWFKGDFDPMQNYPEDFPVEYFLKFTDQEIEAQELKDWVENFKIQYKNLGCDVG